MTIGVQVPPRPLGLLADARCALVGEAPAVQAPRRLGLVAERRAIGGIQEPRGEVHKEPSQVAPTFTSPLGQGTLERGGAIGRGFPMSWEIEGQYFENCSCDAVCPCTWSN